ncbi:MAG TPA: saccharopine dehydrogenase C-terminal domain-containing protein [Nitrososphaerales archaeon]|nr:saccharopine dehydrogenase C-terminal domain-containing protein [Nitrososphaerales archaeon]
MKALVVGLGAVGSVIAQVLLESKAIKSVTMADKNTKHALEIAKLSRSRTEVVRIDADNGEELEAAIEGKGVVVNASHPRFNKRMMDLSLAQGANYVDLAGNGLAEQLAKDKAWKEAGLLAVTGLGEDPGLSNIYARYAADRMDIVEEIRVRDGENSSSTKYEFMLLFSPEVFFSEVLDSPRTFVDGRRVSSPPLSGKEVYEFPEPIGAQPVYLVDHEEVMTLPEYIGKGVSYVDFKLALTDECVAILHTLKKLGLMEMKPVEVRGARVAPIELLNAVIPTPVSVSRTVRGHTGIVVEVRGKKGSTSVGYTLSTMASHEESYRTLHESGTSFLTGVVPAVFVRMLADGKIRQKGVVPPESLDPAPILSELAHNGISTRISRTETAKI